MNWIDTKYINLISPQLQRFKRVENNYNFRCPYCGDSTRNKFKARGYMIQRDQSYSYYCHNCGKSASMRQFLEYIDPEIYREYLRETFIEGNTSPSIEKSTFDFSPPKFSKKKYLKGVKKISQLHWEHPAKTYIIDRKIPNPYHAKLYYSPNFSRWVNELLDYEKLDPKNKEPRLIIPFMDEEGEIFGFQGRSFREDGIRYITIILDDNQPKVYGLDAVDLDKKTYVVEGPIDSMFLDNCIAMAGSAVSKFENLNFVYVYDNEPRNEQIIKQIEKQIDAGNKVCIWPESIKVKDINDMILSGMTSKDIENIIDENTFEGMAAKLNLMRWRKV